MYLLKYLAHCGVCSRRKAVVLIKSGVITVNGFVATMPFSLVRDEDIVAYNGKVVKPEAYVYLMLNKPKDYVTTCRDTHGRKTVIALIRGATKERVYPVGRLDRMSTGLLLFTNDGALAQKLSHPSSNVTKRYRVFLDKSFEKKDLQRFLVGFDLKDGFIKADSCRYGSAKDKRDVVLELHSGRNRIVRRMFKFLGYRVEKLDRTGYAGLTLGATAHGSWYFLTREEIFSLTGL
ncbi:rRNA pseudouridine synthase [Candidatus Dependentiae bacterium]|nr:rRNA pseudouridine synthase [Candidatus Dependentiae bacterium]